MLHMSNKYFLYVGNAYPHKNLSRLVEAIVLLNKETSEHVLLKISASRNVFVKRLEESIRKFKADRYVKLLGFVPDKELPNLYKNSIAFVFPSLSEGFGLPGLEAIKAGSLVLASNIPVFKEVYQENAIYFDPYDIRSIKLAMEQALGFSRNDRQKRIEKARRFAKRYSWAKMARETLVVYESCNRLRSG